MKRIISAIFAGALILLGTETLAAEPARTRQRESKEALEAFEKTVPLTEADFEYELTEDGNGIRLTKYIGKSSRIRIPDEIDDMPVVELGEALFKHMYLFDSMPDMEVVYIPDTIKNICDFSEQKELKYVRLPENLQTIPSKTFYECKSLEEIYIPDSVRTIGTDAFSSSGLKTIDFPDDVSFKYFYNSECFDYNSICSYCKQLTSVHLPSSLTEIPESMFSNCESLKSIEIPSKVTSIKSYAFSFCRSLTDVTFSSNLTCIESYAFLYCTSLSELTLPENLKKLGYNAFESVPMKNLIIPDSVIEISSNKKGSEDGSIYLGVSNCDNLHIPNWITKLCNIPSCVKIINFPASLKTCNLNDNYEELEDIIIPDSLKSIDFSKADFSSAKLPLKTQKRLRDLGYTGNFAGTRPAKK
jgi:hypothetical protein